MTKQRVSPSSLFKKCDCDEPNNCKRYQCGACIQSYIRAVSYDEALEESLALDKLGFRIAAERVAEYATELHYNRRLTKED